MTSVVERALAIACSWCAADPGQWCRCSAFTVQCTPCQDNHHKVSVNVEPTWCERGKVCHVRIAAVRVPTADAYQLVGGAS